MTFKTELKLIDAVVGGSSLIGVGGKAPHSWANYFWFSDGSRCYNFWAENLEAACKEFLTDGKVQVVEYTWAGGKGAIVVDARIPDNWFYNKLCFTGGYKPPVEVARAIYELLGDPTNELEQFTDVKSYYEKRGATYNNGTIKYNIKQQPKKLEANWTVESTVGATQIGTSAIDAISKTLESEIAKSMKAEDTGFFYCPYIPIKLEMPDISLPEIEFPDLPDISDLFD